MDKDTYLKSRVDNQMAWFSKKSGWNQKRYKIIKTVEVSLAVIIPFLAGLSGSANSNNGLGWTSVAIGILGVFIAIGEAIQSLYKFHENWIQYRMTKEVLQHEKMLFLTNTGAYNKKPEDSFKIFVERIENILAQETNRWKNYNSNQDKEEGEAR
ncbi:MAG: DUF4231 domain-containing protein [Bacteroidota bacterium]